MCGIAGFVGKGSREVLGRMAATLVHRGPDDEGFFFVPGEVGFGFRRLAIIDLKTGNQPIFNEDRSVAVMLNGEIYNFQELRRELVEKQHTFRTAGDTEVIAHLYEESGELVFEKLNGMFAIAIWDSRRKCLLLARDRFGKKPLYYSVTGGTLIFGSEPKAILQHPLARRELNITVVPRYLMHEYVPAPETMFKDIHRLEPAHYLVFRGGTLAAHAFYRMRFGDKGGGVSETECLWELDERLASAVQARLVSDVPLGVFLSGGLDSSAVSYYAQRFAGKRLQSFSIGFDDPSFDESRYARRVAALLGTEHHEKILSARDLTDLVPQIAALLDEPIANAAIIPNYLLSRFARSEVTVALGGDGGDELFMGYPTFQAERLAEWFCRLPRAVRRGVIAPLVERLPSSFGYISVDYRLKRFFLGLEYGRERRDIVWIGSFTPEGARELLTGEARAAVAAANDFATVERYYREVADRPFLEQAAYVYFKTYLADGVLAIKDRASMFASLELRAPLLDYRLVDFVNSLPVSLKLHGFTTKYLLKKLMAGRLPPAIIHRTKQGFGTPLARWFRHDLRDFCNEVLSHRHTAEIGLFNHEVVERLKAEHFSGRKDNRKPLWTLMAFYLWYQHWMR